MGWILGCFCGLVYIGIPVAILAGMWMIFVKAGKPGWAGIIPIYNIIILMEILDRPVWHIVFFFIPIANIAAWVIVSLELAAKFHKSQLFAVGMILLSIVFIPLLGFGDAKFDPSVPGMDVLREKKPPAPPATPAA